VKHTITLNMAWQTIATRILISDSPAISMFEELFEECLRDSGNIPNSVWFAVLSYLLKGDDMARSYLVRGLCEENLKTGPARNFPWNIGLQQIRGIEQKEIAIRMIGLYLDSKSPACHAVKDLDIVDLLDERHLLDFVASLNLQKSESSLVLSQRSVKDCHKIKSYRLIDFLGTTYLSMGERLIPCESVEKNHDELWEVQCEESSTYHFVKQSQLHMEYSHAV